MKTSLLMLLAILTTTSVRAMSIKEVTSGFDNDAEANAITINKDGSVTIKDIQIVRGDISYSVGIEYDSDYTNACKLLGFDSHLDGAGLNTWLSQDGVKVFLKVDGSFLKTKNHHAKVDKVTCIKQGQLKTVVLFDKVLNADKSTKITNISYLRGDLAFAVGIEYESDYTNTCKLLGYENALEGAGLNSWISSDGPKVFINVNGGYLKIKSHHAKVEKINCYAGAEPSLVVLVGGNRYMRVIP